MKMQWEIGNNERIKMNERNNGKMDEKTMGIMNNGRIKMNERNNGKMNENTMGDQ
jgi:hypothetical protein